MRTLHLLLLAALLGLPILVCAQALSDTFLLGAVFVTNDDPNVNRYANVKADMPFNCVFDALKRTTMWAATDADIWIMGVADPYDSVTSRRYYNGISGLGKWSTAGQYWACSGIGKNPYDATVWHDSRTGSDYHEDIGWVRRADSTLGDHPDTLMSRLHGGFMPFYWAKQDTLRIGQTVVNLHKFYVRIYGRLLESGSGNPPVLTIQANWMDGDSFDYHLAKWTKPYQGDSTQTAFYASQLSNSWSLTDTARELYVQNPPFYGNTYWRGSLSIYWTGQRDLEISYVTISDSLGDAMVYGGSHPYDAYIDSAANVYNGTKLFRHYIVDEPYWGQVWANQYIDSVIGARATSLPYTNASLITREPPELEVDDIAGRLVTTLVDGMREAGTHSATFDGSKLASGIYLAKLQAGDFTTVQKLVLMK